MNPKVRLYNMLHSTGGTIGLFLGASIVSVVEAAFWIYKVATTI